MSKNLNQPTNNYKNIFVWTESGFSIISPEYFVTCDALSRVRSWRGRLYFDYRNAPSEIVTVVNSLMTLIIFDCNYPVTFYTP